MLQWHSLMKGLLSPMDINNLLHHHFASFLQVLLVVCQFRRKAFTRVNFTVLYWGIKLGDEFPCKDTIPRTQGGCHTCSSKCKIYVLTTKMPYQVCQWGTSGQPVSCTHRWLWWPVCSLWRSRHHSLQVAPPLHCPSQSETPEAHTWHSFSHS